MRPRLFTSHPTGSFNPQIDYTGLLDRHGDQEVGAIEDTNIHSFYNAFCDLLEMNGSFCDIMQFIKRKRRWHNPPF